MCLPHHDEYCNEHGAYWVGQHPVKQVDQGRRDDDTNTAKGVCQNMQEDACKVRPEVSEGHHCLKLEFYDHVCIILL